MRTYPVQLQPGSTYEEWMLISYIPSTRAGGKRTRAYWLARCSCGTEKKVNAEKIMDGQARGSCGCKPKRVLPKERVHVPEGPAVNSVFELGSMA